MAEDKHKNNGSLSPPLALAIAVGMLVFIVWSGEPALYAFLPINLYFVYQSLKRDPPSHPPSSTGAA